MSSVRPHAPKTITAAKPAQPVQGTSRNARLWLHLKLHLRTQFATHLRTHLPTHVRAHVRAHLSDPANSESSPVVLALMLSMCVHALLLSLAMGGHGLGLPGLSLPWGERRGEAPELSVVVAPARVIAAEPAPPVDSTPWQRAPTQRPRLSGRPLASPTRGAQPVVSTPAPAALVRPREPVRAVPEITPVALALPVTQLDAVAANVTLPGRPDGRVDTASVRTLQPAVAALKRSEELPMAMPAIAALPLRVIASAPAAARAPARAPPATPVAAQAAPQAEPANIDTARLELERQERARQVAALQEAARIEASRIEATRLEVQRQEAARQAAMQREAVQQEAARQESARAAAARAQAAQAAQQETDRREAARRAMGRQLDEEAARREVAVAAAAAAAATRPPDGRPTSWSSARRGRLFGRADSNAELVLYAEAWARKIQLNMTFDAVREVAKRPHTHPLVTVAIRRDGSVESVTFVVQSGVAEIDEAIRQIVQSQAPYAAFQGALANEFDVIEIRRTWYFDSSIRLY